MHESEDRAGEEYLKYQGQTSVRKLIELLLRLFYFFQAEDVIRASVSSRGLGDVYKRQEPDLDAANELVGSPTGNSKRLSLIYT